MKARWVRPLFVVAALYDFVLGVLFLAAYEPIYRHFGIALPNHPGYIDFSAAVIAVFGIGFWFVSRSPERNRDIIKMGVLFKLAYSVTVLAYFFRGQIPMLWVPFAWIDLGFAVAFVAALRAVPAPPGRSPG